MLCPVRQERAKTRVIIIFNAFSQRCHGPLGALLLLIYSTYQSHIFPGLIFRYPNLKVVALMFFSGKVVLTGAKSLADIDEGWKVIFALVKSYMVRRQ